MYCIIRKCHVTVCVCSAVRERTCNETEFMCEHGHHCIPRSLLCDGTNDCGDWSDEEHNCQCTSRLVSSRLVSSRLVSSRLVSSRLVSSRLVSSRLVSSRLVSSLHFSCPVLSCPVLSCPVLSCPLLSSPVLSCPVLSCPVLSCPVLSCPVLSCPVLSCPVLSCLVGVLANTPGGVKRSGLGAHACWVIIHVSKLVSNVVVQEC